MLIALRTSTMLRKPPTLESAADEDLQEKKAADAAIDGSSVALEIKLTASRSWRLGVARQKS